MGIAPLVGNEILAVVVAEQAEDSSNSKTNEALQEVSLSILP